jgi:hypothetical protein
MKYLISVLLLIFAGLLFIAEQNHLITSEELQLAANITQVLSLVLALIVFIWPTGKARDTFVYQIRIQDSITESNIKNAKVTIEAGQMAPLVSLSDNNGWARLYIKTRFIDQPGRVVVEATNYQTYRQEIDLHQETVPAVLLLTPTNKPAIKTSMDTDNTRRKLYEADLSLWSSENFETVEYKYDKENNARHIIVKKLRSSGSSTPSTKFLDFDLNTNTEKISGNNRAWYGILIRSHQNDRRIDHRFLISGIGNFTYEIGGFEEDEDEQGDLTIISGAESSPHINQKNQTNHIRLIRRRTVVEFRVNDHHLLTKEISLLPTEEVELGMIVISPKEDKGSDIFVDIAYHDFVVWEAK